jgi:hypothetical protein
MSQLEDIQGSDDTLVTLTYSDVYEGRHCDDEFEQWAVENTSTVETLVEVINSGVSVLSNYGNEPIMSSVPDYMESDLTDVMEGTEVGSEGFTEKFGNFLTSNYMDMDSFIERTVEQWDYKEGSCTVTATVKVTLGDLRQNEEVFSGWTASVPMGKGTYTTEL